MCKGKQFTERAMRVMAFAYQEAQCFNYEYVGTEHILIGLMKEGSGVGATVLKNMGLDLRKIRKETEKLVKSGPDIVIRGELPKTPLAKQVIQFAREEAKKLNHDYIGTEHLLLGLLQVEGSITTRILTNLNLKLEDVRAEVLRLLGTGAKDEPKIEEKENLEKCKIFTFATGSKKTEIEINEFLKTKIRVAERLLSSNRLVIFYKDS